MICRSFSPRFASRDRISVILSPGSMTMASRVVSSPTRVQLHCSGPTGKVSRIMISLSAKPPEAYKWASDECHRMAVENENNGSEKRMDRVAPDSKGLAKGRNAGARAGQHLGRRAG